MRRVLCLALSLLVATPALAAPKPLTPKKQLARYQKVAKKHGCPPFDGADLALPDSWRTPRPALEEHKALRAKTESPPPPESGQRLMIHWSGGHLEIVHGSFAIVRGADGLWRGEGVQTSEIPIRGPNGEPPRPTITKAAWTLPADDSAKMDALVASPCLAVEPRSISRMGSMVGGGHTTLEVFDAQENRLTTIQHGGRWGVTGQILNLAFAKAPN
ncbi:hypothetical protein [Caulobacter segnis]